jgi:RimJ/RimL family protein N-acetyltransferase
MDTAERRRTIGHLLDERQPANAMAAYFAFYHPVERTQLFTTPAGAERAEGYIALSRTGMDLFRPLLTLRLSPDLEQATALIYEAIRPETPVILSSPDDYMPLIRACFTIESEEYLQVMVLDPARFEPVVNVLVTHEEGIGGRPRFVIRNRTRGNEVLAAASVNWLYPHFAEVSVTTQAGQRRQGYGRSVMAALVNYLLGKGIRPLYVVRTDNTASIRLARNLGFFDTGQREWLLHAILKPSPTDP